MINKKILGLHYRDTKNIGDRHCHPLDYFHFDRSRDDVVIKGDSRYPPEDMNPDWVILGGGAIGRSAPEILQKYKDAKLIAWGIGVTQPRLELPSTSAHTKYSKGYALWGARDVNVEAEYVPCVSCMHPIFDSPPLPKYPVVIYGHASRFPLREEAEKLGIPYMENNNAGGFADAIAHLASGEVVITSSYHGAYWATLLGRRVSMLPFGSKFFGLKFKPPVVDGAQSGIDAAVAFPDALSDCRNTTKKFASKVHKIIWS